MPCRAFFAHFLWKIFLTSPLSGDFSVLQPPLFPRQHTKSDPAHTHHIQITQTHQTPRPIVYTQFRSPVQKLARSMPIIRNQWMRALSLEKEVVE